MSKKAKPVLIERALLLKAEQPDSKSIDLLVSFQRSGYRLLLIAPRPRRWRPTRNSVDQDLAIQQSLHQLFSRGGAEMDGVCYLPTGLFSKTPGKQSEFDDIAQRYDLKVSDLVLIGSDQGLLDAFQAAGGQVIAVGKAKLALNGPSFDSLAHAIGYLSSATD